MMSEMNEMNNKELNMKKITKKHKQDEDSPIITCPQIDKLGGAVTLNDEQMHGVIVSNMIDMIQGYEAGISKAPSSSKYPTAIKVHYPACKDALVTSKSPFVLLQATSKNAPKLQIRFDYNPSHMSEAGEEHLAGVFNALMGVDSFYEFLYHARFTRVDWCRNIMWRDLQDYLVKSLWTKVSTCHVGNDGKSQTLTFGKAPSLQIIAYDKAKQLHGDNVGHGTIRIEARCPTNVDIHGLATMANPFRRVEIYSLKCSNPPFGVGHWRAFQDSCRLRGVNNAIKNQPTKYRPKLKKAVSEQTVDWWGMTDEVWQHMLTNALEDAGLTQIPDYAPPLTMAVHSHAA